MRSSLLLTGLIVASANGPALRPTQQPALTEAQQIASAVLPLPTQFRATAQVMGYKTGSTKLATIRTGTGAFICLASDPAGTNFHVACYHRSLEPFMARGRALREAGTAAPEVDSTRFKEVRSGALAMPKTPTALYQLTGPAGSYDLATNTIKGATPLTVLYVSGATAESIGLPSVPGKNGEPWIMLGGTPKAHIMLVGHM